MVSPSEQAGLVTDWVPRPFMVRGVTRETSDTVTLELVPQDGAGVPPHAPGQFMMLYAFGIGEVPISISGSRSGSAEEPESILHTVRAVGAVTRALCSLEVGAVLGLRGPFGSHWPIAEQRGRDVVIAAGGIGLAPLRPVVEHVIAQREAYDDVVLLYGARSPDQLLYASDVERWRAAGVQVEVTVDRVDPPSSAWQGHIGVVTTLIRYARFQTEQAAAFLCGPEVMMRFMAQELNHRGVDSRRTFVSMERNMKCAVGMCGHCQLGPEFLCLDGPVFPWPRVEPLIAIPQL